MPQSPFLVLVSDLLGRTGARRTEHLAGPLDIVLDQVEFCGEAKAEVVLEAMADGLIVRGFVEAPTVLRCNRCLIEVEHRARATITQAFGLPSEGEILSIDSDGSIDLKSVLHDELSLSIPLVPVCTEDCLGLCPVCGTDLNKDPCDGHGEELKSPFAALKDLFEP
jgi:uncharacterized protein